MTMMMTMAMAAGMGFALRPTIGGGAGGPGGPGGPGAISCRGRRNIVSDRINSLSIKILY